MLGLLLRAYGPTYMARRDIELPSASEGQVYMADVLLLEFTAPEAVAIYRSVSRLLGVDPSTGSGDWPPPLVTHVAGESGRPSGGSGG